MSDNLRWLGKELEHTAATMVVSRRALNHDATALDSEVRRVRMLPFSESCRGLSRTVRDLARSAGKKIEVVVEDDGVELDRAILEKLKDPLVHLVRNAADHGIESPPERKNARKPPEARITISATLKGAQVEIGVADDGRGLDANAIRKQAAKRNIAAPEDDDELAQLLFAPGFSTARMITDVSGRGVGLDVVRTQIEALHGRIDVASKPQEGTRFALTVPIAMTTIRALVVEAAGQSFVIAGPNVAQLVTVGPHNLKSVNGRDRLLLGESPIPVALLADALEMRDIERAPASGQAQAVVVTAGSQRMAFVVDALVSEQEVMVKSLGARIKRIRNLTGATILSNGKIALIVNAAELLRNAAAQRPAQKLSEVLERSTPETRKRILLADDSVTIRTLQKRTLEAAGYSVTVAVDGAEAWQILQQGGADVVVTDVEMPRMDGFGLTEAIRNSRRFAELPVVLVTALSSDRDKAHGLDVGASAYIVKGGFEQRSLLETIARLV